MSLSHIEWGQNGVIVINQSAGWSPILLPGPANNQSSFSLLGTEGSFALLLYFQNQQQGTERTLVQSQGGGNMEEAGE